MMHDIVYPKSVSICIYVHMHVDTVRTQFLINCVHFVDAVFYELCLASDAVFDSCILIKRVDFKKNRRWRGIFTIHTSCDARRVHILHGRSFCERNCVYAWDTVFANCVHVVDAV